MAQVTDLPCELITEILKQLDFVWELPPCLRASPIFLRAYNENRFLAVEILKRQVGAQILVWATLHQESQESQGSPSSLPRLGAKDLRCIWEKPNIPAILKCLRSYPLPTLIHMARVHKIIDKGVSKQLHTELLTWPSTIPAGVETPYKHEWIAFIKLEHQLGKVELSIREIEYKYNPNEELKLWDSHQEHLREIKQDMAKLIHTLQFKDMYGILIWQNIPEFAVEDGSKNSQNMELAALWHQLCILAELVDCAITTL
ncbi:hypothetical protein GGR57DRAFT_453187 [Xylariaceae sp. FL1272]|nr:hypothetical protein GGR57DRAFT_453187 [Xylariaceae sp. FL1272]